MTEANNPCSSFILNKLPIRILASIHHALSIGMGLPIFMYGIRELAESVGYFDLANGFDRRFRGFSVVGVAGLLQCAGVGAQIIFQGTWVRWVQWRFARCWVGFSYGMGFEWHCFDIVWFLVDGWPNRFKSVFGSSFVQASTRFRFHSLFVSITLTSLNQNLHPSILIRLLSPGTGASGLYPHSSPNSGGRYHSGWVFFSILRHRYFAFHRWIHESTAWSRIRYGFRHWNVRAGFL